MERNELLERLVKADLDYARENATAAEEQASLVVNDAIVRLKSLIATAERSIADGDDVATVIEGLLLGIDSVPVARLHSTRMSLAEARARSKALEEIGALL